jgi:type I restriction enzyme S subunit
MEVNVTPGFKQTEVGVIPRDWETYTLQDLINQNAIVGHLDGNHGELYPRSHEFKEFGVPYVTANDLCGHIVNLNNCKYLSEERASRFKKGVAKNGDVLFAHNATVGPTALLSTKLNYVILSTTATYFRCNPEKLFNSFLLCMLQSPLFVGQYRAVMAQSTRNQVPITAQRKLSIAVPPTLGEQEVIAKALSDADFFIESLEQLVAKKRQIKQGVMQELLTGKRRLPGFSGEWEVKRFGEICQPRKERFDARRAGIQKFCVEMEHIDQGTGSLIGNTATGPTSSLKSVFHINDVLFGKLRAYLRKYWLANRDGVCSTEIWVLIAKHSVLDPKFLFQIVKMDRFIDAASSAYGTHMPRSDWKVVRNFEVNLPPFKEQSAIATTLSEMDAEIAALEAKLEKARQIKQGMMRELLRGRIRLI